MGKKRRVKKYLQKFGNKFKAKFSVFLQEAKIEEPQPEIIEEKEEVAAIINETPTLERVKPEEVVEPKPKPKPKAKPKAKPAVKKRQRVTKRKTTKRKTT